MGLRQGWARFLDRNNVRVEQWESNQNRKEIHFFVKGFQEVYLFGFNPQLLPEAKVKKFLKELGFEI